MKHAVYNSVDLTDLIVFAFVFKWNLCFDKKLHGILQVAGISPFILVLLELLNNCNLLWTTGKVLLYTQIQ